MFILNKYKRVLTSIYRNNLRGKTLSGYSSNTSLRYGVLTIYYAPSSLRKYYNNLRWALRIYPLRLFTHTSPTYFD